MNLSKTEAILTRFLKGFAAAGLAAVGAALANGVTIHNLGDAKQLFFTLLMAFITGGFLAAEKWLNWVDPQVPTPPAGSNEAQA